MSLGSQSTFGSATTRWLLYVSVDMPMLPQTRQGLLRTVPAGI
ncbi:hypothetical protein THTE_1364 [Thermogutta terrifontis]|uniref:Uncharacterized protein n=1 Tax=Thermogutta terrifontis TaxID=1331910 RepID=A0A286RDC7_9BACT|nr:hypothetical protein THTE_1364 [Thermogutta terrifontis]